MSFTDHKITAFAHRVSDLPDEPQIPAAELKSRFDACPEELRQSLNAVCDDAARLETRVEGIVVDTFGDTIDKEMLSDELAAELDGKATQTALAAEAAAREAADDALNTRVTTVETTLPLKCEVIWGIYDGNTEASQDISLGFQPKAVIVISANGFMGDDFHYNGGIAFINTPCKYDSTRNILQITETGFRVFYEYFDGNRHISTNQGEHYYIAFR